MNRRGAYAKGTAKRQEILVAVLDVIAELGLRNASVREIADAVNLSPAGLLHYFGSKEELFVAVLAARDERDTQEAGHDNIFAAVLGVVAHNTTVPGLVRLYAQMAAEAGDSEHPAHAYFTKRAEEIDRPSAENIAAAQRAGYIRADLDPEWIVRAGHALADGLQTAWLLNPEIDMVADLEQFIALLRP